MARIYIAAPWAEREMVPAIHDTLVERGHSITHKWWEVELGNLENSGVNRECAQNDVMGVFNANILLLLNTSKSEGKAVEQGLALALGRPIVAVGKAGEHGKNIFHFLNEYRWTEDLNEAYRLIDRIGEEL